jgi:hypothetical protein
MPPSNRAPSRRLRAFLVLVLLLGTQALRDSRQPPPCLATARAPHRRRRRHQRARRRTFPPRASRSRILLLTTHDFTTHDFTTHDSQPKIHNPRFTTQDSQPKIHNPRFHNPRFTTTIHNPRFTARFTNHDDFGSFRAQRIPSGRASAPHSRRHSGSATTGDARKLCAGAPSPRRRAIGIVEWETAPSITGADFPPMRKSSAPRA